MAVLHQAATGKTNIEADEESSIICSEPAFNLKQLPGFDCKSKSWCMLGCQQPRLLV